MTHASAHLPDPPGQFTRAVVRAELHCRRCGYDLRGLKLDGRCAECGLDVWQTVIRETDPTGSRLPRLHDPRGVANGLFFLMVCLLLASTLLVTGPLARTLDQWLGLSGPWLGVMTSPRLPYFAGVAALAGLWSLWKLLPPRRGTAATGWPSVRLASIGLIGWAVMAILLGSLFRGPELVEMRWSAFLLLHGFGATCLLGLGGLFRAIGERSRAYRRSRGGKQSLHTMIATLGLLTLGQMATELSLRGLLGPTVRVLGILVTTVCTFMLVIGLIYLVVNAWWIRRSIVRPPRDLNDLLTPPAIDELTDEAM